MVRYAGEMIAEQANSNINKSLWGNVVYNVKAYGAKGDGVTDDTKVFQKLAAKEGIPILVPEGNYIITSPIYLAKNVTILGFKGKSNVIVPENSNNDVFKINALCSVSGLSVKLLNPQYSGNVFEVSPNTLDIDSPNQLNIQVDEIDFEFYKYTNWDPRLATAILVYSKTYAGNDPKKGKTGFFDITFKNLTSKGRCKYFIRHYSISNGDVNVWITGTYYRDVVIESSSEYGFFGAESEATMLDSTMTDGGPIYFSNWQMQCSLSKNMYFFTTGNKLLKNTIAWDWQNSMVGDDGVKRLPIGVRRDFFGGNGVYVDEEYGAIETRCEVYGWTTNRNTWQYKSNLYQKFTNYTSIFDKISSYKPTATVRLSNINVPSVYPKYFKLGSKTIDRVASTVALNGDFDVVINSSTTVYNLMHVKIGILSTITINSSLVASATTNVKSSTSHSLASNIYHLIETDTTKNIVTVTYYLKQDAFYGIGAYLVAQNVLESTTFDETEALYFDMATADTVSVGSLVNATLVTDSQLFPTISTFKTYDAAGSYGFSGDRLYVKAYWEGQWQPVAYRRSGTTAQRPTLAIGVGESYFDTTLGKPIWWNGTVWKDATGATV